MIRERFIGLLGLLSVFTLSAEAVQFEVIDSENNPVKDVVVIIEDYKNTGGDNNVTKAEMSQTDRQFSPHVLAVPKNTPVTFPNYDNIAHHVYSFSDAKAFEKKLYKGVEEAPVLFDKTGIVEIGCNVHDWMLAYIYVTDAIHFGVTNESGKVTINLPKNGDHKVKLWHPRMEDNDKQIRSLTLTDGVNQIRLSQVIPEEDLLDFDEFDDY